MHEQFKNEQNIKFLIFSYIYDVNRFQKEILNPSKPINFKDQIKNGEIEIISYQVKELNQGEDYSSEYLQKEAAKKNNIDESIKPKIYNVKIKYKGNTKNPKRLNIKVGILGDKMGVLLENKLKPGNFASFLLVDANKIPLDYWTNIPANFNNVVMDGFSNFIKGDKERLYITNLFNKISNYWGKMLLTAALDRNKSPYKITYEDVKLYKGDNIINPQEKWYYSEYAYYEDGENKKDGISLIIWDPEKRYTYKKVIPANNILKTAILEKNLAQVISKDRFAGKEMFKYKLEINDVFKRICM